MRAQSGRASEIYAQTMAPGVVRLWHRCEKVVVSPGAGGVSVPFSCLRIWDSVVTSAGVAPCYGRAEARQEGCCCWVCGW